jgi:hypothetical protein
MSFGGFSAGPHCQDRPAVVGRILDSGGLAITGPEMLDFSIQRVLKAKVQATPHANLDALCLSIIIEWDLPVAEHIHKACCSFCRCLKAVMAKNDAFI